MSLHPEDPTSPPEETRRVARPPFPKGPSASTSPTRSARSTGTAVRRPVPRLGQRGTPARLALATVLQFVEGLSDRQAADAVRGRIDWKYALGLELTDPGFDHTVLSEFRLRLVDGERRALLLLDTLLARLRELGLVKRARPAAHRLHPRAGGGARPQPARAGRRDLRAALNELAAVAPDWLRALAPAAWYERYGERVENYACPKSEAERRELAAAIGADGHELLLALEAANRPELGALPAVHGPAAGLGRAVCRDGGPGRLARGRGDALARRADLLALRPQARYSSKRGTAWVGYKVQLTETCDPDLPSLIVNVETTPATTPDDNMLAACTTRSQRGTAAGRAPGRQGLHRLPRAGRQPTPLSASTVVGPVADDPSWQAREGEGFAKAAFLVDWERRVVTCPAGKRSISWLPNTYPKNGMVSRPASPGRTARRARCAPAAPGPSSSRGSSACRRASTTRPCTPPGTGRRRRSSARATRRAPASRPPTSRPSAAAACAMPATSGSPRRTCNIIRAAAINLVRDRKLGERHSDRPDPLLMVCRPQKAA